MNYTWLIGSSIFGLILLGLGLAIRFKISSNEKNGVYINTSISKTSKIDFENIESHLPDDWSTINPATGLHMKNMGGFDLSGNPYGSDD
jgi:hypothetical protein